MKILINGLNNLKRNNDEKTNRKTFRLDQF